MTPMHRKNILKVSFGDAYIFAMENEEKEAAEMELLCAAWCAMELAFLERERAWSEPGLKDHLVVSTDGWMQPTDR